MPDREGQSDTSPHHREGSCCSRRRVRGRGDSAPVPDGRDLRTTGSASSASRPLPEDFRQPRPRGMVLELEPLLADLGGDQFILRRHRDSSPAAIENAPAERQPGQQQRLMLRGRGSAREQRDVGDARPWLTQPDAAGLRTRPGAGGRGFGTRPVAVIVWRWEISWPCSGFSRATRAPSRRQPPPRPGSRRQGQLPRAGRSCAGWRQLAWRHNPQST